MHINILGLNCCTVSTKAGILLFSYQTPVAFVGKNTGYLKTSKFWSKTTSKHINAWVGHTKDEVKEVDQEWFDKISLDIDYNHEAL